MSLVLLVGVYAVSYDKRHFNIAISLMIPTIIINWVVLFLDIPFLILLFYILSIVFYGYTTITILINVLNSKKITHDTLFGAICVYLLIGITWGTIFSLIEFLSPGSFYIGAGRNIDNIINWSDSVYYSFVTLTTAGYGDITPITSHARSLSIIEVIIGVMYTAILIARFVGLYNAQNKINNHSFQEAT
jgi:hypothetical protein